MKKILDDIQLKQANELDRKARYHIRNGQKSFGQDKTMSQARATTYARRYESLTGEPFRI